MINYYSKSKTTLDLVSHFTQSVKIFRFQSKILYDHNFVISDIVQQVIFCRVL